MPSIRRFKTLDDCRKALAHTYRQLEADEIDPRKARTLIYGALSISQVISGTSLEDRIADLEQQAESLRRRR